jgi:hypothetical protein
MRIWDFKTGRVGRWHHLCHWPMFWLISFAFLLIIIAGTFHGVEGHLESHGVSLGYCDPPSEYYVSIRHCLSWADAGHKRLPPYHLHRTGAGGYFEAWNDPDGIRLLRSGTVDYPYWPNGDPGLGPNNPLPPFVCRIRTYYVRPSILRILGAVLLSAWLWLGYIRWRRDRDRRTSASGFDPVMVGDRYCQSTHSMSMSGTGEIVGAAEDLKRDDPTTIKSFTVDLPGME